MHEHTECEHKIKYCKVCDVCYCEKCNKQWYIFKMTYSPTTYIDMQPYTITYNTDHTHE